MTDRIPASHIEYDGPIIDRDWILPKAVRKQHIYLPDDPVDDEEAANKAYVDDGLAAQDALSELVDVTITSPADGTGLYYDLASGKWVNGNIPGEWRRQQDDLYDGQVGAAHSGWRIVLVGAVFTIYEESHIRIYGRARISPQTDANAWSLESLQVTLNGVAPVAPTQSTNSIYANTTHQARQTSLEFRYTWKNQVGIPAGTAYTPRIQVQPSAAGGDVWAIDPYMEIDVCKA